MAGWITHMMIADRVGMQMPQLDRVGFCVGNVAPDCNVENADWSAFTPPREVTHWMSGSRKGEEDCERFRRERIAGQSFCCEEERSFFLGYYAHLLTDACFQRFIRDPRRVRDMLARIHAVPEFSARMSGFEDDFDGVKKAFAKWERMRDVDQLEYEYLHDHPCSGYMTVLREIRDFPDYMDILPAGAIVRKISVMAVMPESIDDAGFVFFSRAEYNEFVDEVCGLVAERLEMAAGFMP